MNDTTTTTPAPEVSEFIDQAVRAAAAAVREGVDDLLTTYATKAATLDLPLAYRDGVHDAAGLVAAYLRGVEDGAR